MRHLLVFLMLAGFGFARLHFEDALTQEHRAAYFHGAKLNLGMRQQIGQLGFLAALSGFRSLVADVLWIRGHAAWMDLQWGRMKVLFDNVTALQPRAQLFWDNAAWHMAWNASVAALENKDEPREALRIKAQREYFRLGEDYLLRGIANNPDQPYLFERLGDLYRDKLNDPCRASDAYGKASSLPGTRPYNKRFALYMMAECPGREREALARLIDLHRLSTQEHLPTLLVKIKTLQEKLNIPLEQRIEITLPPEDQ